MRDPLADPAGGPNGAAAGEERLNGGASGGWMSDSRWSGLRKRGEAAGWLVDPSQVPRRPTERCTGEHSGDAGVGTCCVTRWAQSNVCVHSSARSRTTICMA